MSWTCKQKDTGGRVLLEDNWTTFVKARMNCSLPGKFPFYYNQLQSTYLLRKQRLLYAVFTTPPSVSVASWFLFIYIIESDQTKVKEEKIELK